MLEEISSFVKIFVRKKGEAMSVERLKGEIAALSALDDPIRLKLYRVLVDAADWINRDQAAAALGIARHVAKFNLDRLEEEGLLEVDYKRPSGRQGPGAGRPTKYYRRSTREISVTLPERHYDFAGSLLARAIVDSTQTGAPIGEALRKSARTAGKLIAREVVDRVGANSNQSKIDSTEEKIVEVLAEHGYEPKKDLEGISLLNCPFHSLAKEYTSLVCGMNEDLIHSFLEELPTQLHALLQPEDGRCCIRLVN